MNRRQLIKVGGSLGALAAAGWWGRNVFLASRPSRILGSVDDLAVRLYEGLDPGTRERACVDSHRREYAATR